MLRIRPACGQLFADRDVLTARLYPQIRRRALAICDTRGHDQTWDVRNLAFIVVFSVATCVMIQAVFRKELPRMRLWTFFFALFGCFTFFSCATPSAQYRQQDALFDLYVIVEPKDAVILIDDAVFGTGNTTKETPLRVTAGTKRVEIRRDGYYPFRTTLEYIQPGEVYTLTTHLIQSEF